MPMMTLRDLGGVGVVADINPSNLPPNAFSSANNVRFANGKLMRAPVLRTVVPAIKSTLPYGDATGTYADSTGFYNNTAPLSLSPVQRFMSVVHVPEADDLLVVADNDGTVRSFRGGTFDDVSPGSGWTRTVSEDPWSATELAGIHYLNRGYDKPYYINPQTMDSYDLLPNWPSTLRAKVVRAYGDFLVAFNITKDGVEMLKTVKWSDITLSGQVPGSWDETSTTNSAGENTLAQLTGPIVDACVLGDSMFIYSSDQVWAMDYNGGDFVFTFRRAFATGGALNVNCVVEADQKAFVFGYDDIYVHDGTSKKSISEGRVRSYIYNTMTRSKAKYAHAVHNPFLSEVLFLYHSQDVDVRWINASYCNKAAVYNYVSDTWAFMDIPNVPASCVATVTTSPLYENAEGGFQTAGGSFAIQQDDGLGQPMMLGVYDTGLGISESRIYGLDLLVGGRLPFPVADEVLCPSHATRVGIDLDESGAELRGYKVLKAVYPQAMTYSPDGTIQWAFGADDYPAATAQFGPEVSFDPTTDYKIDTLVAGRYLGFSIRSSGAVHFEVSGFDSDVQITGRR